MHMRISPMVAWGNIMFLWGSMKTLKFYVPTRNSTGFYTNLIKNLQKPKTIVKHVKTADNIPQVCCLRVDVVPCVIMSHEDHKTL